MFLQLLTQCVSVSTGPPALQVDRPAFGRLIQDSSLGVQSCHGPRNSLHTYNNDYFLTKKLKLFFLAHTFVKHRISDILFVPHTDVTHAFWTCLVDNKTNGMQSSVKWKVKIVAVSIRILFILNNHNLKDSNIFNYIKKSITLFIPKWRWSVTFPLFLMSSRWVLGESKRFCHTTYHYPVNCCYPELGRQLMLLITAKEWRQCPL